MELDFGIPDLTAKIAAFYAQRRRCGVQLPRRRTVTLQFPDGLMAHACSIAKQIHDSLVVCSWSFLFFLAPFVSPPCVLVLCSRRF